MKHNFNQKKAFTLIELLIVIAIIGILFIVLVSRVDFATDKAKASGVQTDFRSFQVALDTVAKENAGFNTFGYNTGDNAGAIPAGYAFESTETENKTKGDGIRNSYDQGDKNLNGKQDINGKDGYTGTTEVFTGRKIYTEKWTDVWTLVNPADTAAGYDADAIFALESAINKNLDPKLHITIAADGKITMANQARDPWKNEYHGYYITNAETDKGDRGAIVIYSNGANGKWGSAHVIENGVVTVGVPGNNVNGKDDYSLVSCYSYLNGYGQVINGTTGFSNNQTFLGGNVGNNNLNNTPNAPDTVTYNIIRGANQTIVLDADSAEFASDADFNKFLKVVVDTTDLVENEHYTVRSGSTVVTLKNAFIETLSVGEHTMYVHSDDGFATCKFNIEASRQPETIAFTATFDDGVTLTFEELKLASNGTKYGYRASEITDNSFGQAFSYCRKLVSITIGSNITSIDDEAFWQRKNLKSVVIADSVTSIGQDAFYLCNSLSSITFGKGSQLTTIERGAFSNTALETIELPAKVSNLDLGAFEQCFVKEILVDPANPYYTSIDGNLYSKDGKTFLAYARGKREANVVIPQGVTGIGSSAFEGYSLMHTVSIPNSVTSIGASAFAECNNLDDVVIPSGVTVIEENTFGSCGLTSIEMPGVVTIKDSAFYNCSDLEVFNVGEKLKDIGTSVFEYCTSLRYIEVDDNNQYFMEIDGNLYSKDGKTIVQYAIGKEDSSFVIPESVTTIGASAFMDAFNLTSITIPSSVTRIEELAFFFCNDLKTINFNGTSSEWNAIVKGSKWNESMPSYTINYTNGSGSGSGYVPK